MTEEQVERRVEKMVDVLDRRFMAGMMDQAQYDAKMQEITEWADAVLRGDK